MDFLAEFQALQGAVQVAGRNYFCSKRQYTALCGLIKDEFDSREQRLQFYEMVTGRQLDTGAELTAGEAGMLIDYFLEPGSKPWTITEEGSELIHSLFHVKQNV
jgi:hypothetical protein